MGLGVLEMEQKRFDATEVCDMMKRNIMQGAEVKDCDTPLSKANNQVQ